MLQASCRSSWSRTVQVVVEIDACVESNQNRHPRNRQLTGWERGNSNEKRGTNAVELDIYLRNKYLIISSSKYFVHLNNSNVQVPVRPSGRSDEGVLVGGVVNMLVVL